MAKLLSRSRENNPVGLFWPDDSSGEPPSYILIIEDRAVRRGEGGIKNPQ